MMRTAALLGGLLAIAASSIAGCGSSGGPNATGCDLVEQTGCGAGEKCTFVCGAAGAVVGCAPDGTLAVGAACPGADMCVAGSFCAASFDAPAASCRAFCSTDADCPSGTCMQLPIRICGTDTMAGICG